MEQAPWGNRQFNSLNVAVGLCCCGLRKFLPGRNSGFGDCNLCSYGVLIIMGQRMFAVAPTCAVHTAVSGLHAPAAVHRTAWVCKHL